MHALAWCSRYDTRARTFPYTDITPVYGGHRGIVMAINYIVLEGVPYNGFLLFINGRARTELPLERPLHPA